MLGKPLLVISANCDNFLTALEQWMESMCRWTHHPMLATSSSITWARPASYSWGLPTQNMNCWTSTSVATSNFSMAVCWIARQPLDTNQLCFPPPNPKALPSRDLPVPLLALRPNLLKPYSQRGPMIVLCVAYNWLSRSRLITVFSIMSACFRELRKSIHLDANITKKVVLACSVLHNYLMTTYKKKRAPANALDHYDNKFIPSDWRRDEAGESMYLLRRSRTNTFNANVQN